MQRRLQTFRKECDALDIHVASGLRDLFKVADFLVDETHQVMFRVIYKAASTAWLAALSKAMGGSSTNETLVRSEDYLKSLGLKRLNGQYYNQLQIEYMLDNYFKFIVIRHPYDRIHSGWRDLRSGKPLNDNIYVMQSSLRAHRSARPPSFADPKKMKWLQNMTFGDFVQYLDDTRQEGTYWPWLTYQSLHPCAVKWDAILKVETMSTDAPLVLEKLGLFNYTLPWMNAYGSQDKSARFRKSLPDFKSVTTEWGPNFLSDQYYGDMSMFGYSWNDNTQEAVCSYRSEDGNAQSCC